MFNIIHGECFMLVQCHISVNDASNVCLSAEMMPHISRCVKLKDGVYCQGACVCEIWPIWESGWSLKYPFLIDHCLVNCELMWSGRYPKVKNVNSHLSKALNSRIGESRAVFTQFLVLKHFLVSANVLSLLLSCCLNARN